MTTISNLIAAKNSTSEINEASYVEQRENVQRALEKAMAIKGIIASFETEVAAAVLKFNEQLVTLEGNFKVKLE